MNDQKLEMQHLLWAGARVLAASLVFGSICGCDSPPSVPAGPDTIGAWVACQEFVGKRLKAPSTADFQSYDESGVVVESSNSFTVHGYVDAQNSFGAKLRSNYTCRLHTSSSQWLLDDISIN
jgi:hypothetical protein